MKQTDKIITIHDDEYFYSSGYYTDNRWLDDDTLIVARCKDEKDPTAQLIKYSLKDNTIEVLCEDAWGYSNHVVWKDLVYYTDGQILRVLDTKTKEIKVIYEKDFDDIAGLNMPSITNDGKAICIYNEQDGGGFFLVVDAETGEKLYTFEKSFAPPFKTANHGMICPTNPYRMFFAHEGTTFYVSNRLWLYDAKLDKAWNIAKQYLDEEGNLGDCFGHEMWAPDGKGMFFTKYPCSPKGPRGVGYVDIETGKTEILYSGFNYWHTGVSQDGKFITADTCDNGTTYSEVIVVDRSDNTETLIDTPEITWNHPCHPHPQMSPNNTKVAYTALDDERRLCIKVAYLK